MELKPVTNKTHLLPDSKLNSNEDGDFQLFLKMAEHTNVLHIDTESNGQPIKDGRGYAIGMSIDFAVDSNLAYSYYFPFRHRNGSNLNWSYRDQLKKLIEDPNKTKVAHNARFDIDSSKTLGIDFGMNFDCTMLLAHNVNENLPSYSLDWLTRDLGLPGKARDGDFKDWVKLLGWDGVPPENMGEYATTDATLLRPLRQHYKSIYDKEDDSKGEVWENDKEFMLLLNEIERNGARVDLSLAEKEIERGEKRMAELTNIIGLNPGSPTQLQQLLFDQIGITPNPAFVSEKTGKPSLNKQAMEYYEEELLLLKSPVAEQVLEYRGYQKAVSSYWKAYIEHVSPDGRIRPNFNLHRTKTHRLSCDTPNLQQIPRVTAKPWNRLVKSGFIPEEGYEIWEADYSQLEMRLTAAYAKQQNLIEIFSDPTRDLFTEMATELGLERDPTKTLNYALGYGAGDKKIAAMLGISIAAARQIKNNYFDTYSGFRTVNQLAQQTCKGQGFVRTWTTRRRHFDNPTTQAHKAFNSVIQMGAADIVKRVMVNTRKNLDPEVRMILQVHDSVWYEIPKGPKLEFYKSEIVRLMEIMPVDFGVPFKVDIHQIKAA
jgi:DNA polymerase-1